MSVLGKEGNYSLMANLKNDSYMTVPRSHLSRAREVDYWSGFDEQAKCLTDF